MFFTIKYKNVYDELVDPVELEGLNSYEKCFYQEGELKKVEDYRNGELCGGSYYLAKEENEKEIIDQLFEEGLASLTILKKESYGSYIIERGKHFVNKKLFGRSQSLYDENGKEICYQDVDEKTEQAIYFETEKYLYNEENEKALSFEYKADGSIKYIWGSLVDDANIYKNEGANWREQSIAGQDIEKYFPRLLKDNLYYKDAVFLPTINKAKTPS